MNSNTAKIANFGAGLAAIVLVAVPFHAFLSVWVGSIYGGYDTVKLWKEALLVLLAISVLFLLAKDKLLWRWLGSWPVFWVILAYAGLHLGIGAYAFISEYVSLGALVYGFVVNLRFVWFFLACMVVAARSPWLRARWRSILFVPAALVVVFGLLQLFVLPDDILRHVGYSPDTIPAYQSVDQKQDYARVQSTLRGPNPLGAYLILIIAASAAVLLVQKNTRLIRWAGGSLLAGSLVVLVGTYSRSAYIGAAVALGVVCWLTIRSARIRQILLVSVTCVVLAGGAAVFVLRDNDRIQNVFFHTDEHSISPKSSNEDRASALKNGIKDSIWEPLGRGPGTAGPASVYNDGRARIAENYYLQITQEVGWLGFTLFAAIILAVGWELLNRKRETLAVSLFASLAGISVINLLSHAWTDDTLNLLWWGLAGVALVPAILKRGSDESQ